MGCVWGVRISGSESEALETRRVKLKSFQTRPDSALGEKRESRNISANPPTSKQLGTAFFTQTHTPPPPRLGLASVSEKYLSSSSLFYTAFPFRLSFYPSLIKTQQGERSDRTRVLFTIWSYCTEPILLLILSSQEFPFKNDES